MLFSGVDRWIVVSPDGAPTTPRIGDNVLIVCEVAEDSPYNNPKWLGPNDEEVQPLGSSKFVSNGFGSSKLISNGFGSSKLISN